jgi:hypothetical protein
MSAADSGILLSVLLLVPSVAAVRCKSMVKLLWCLWRAGAGLGGEHCEPRSPHGVMKVKMKMTMKMTMTMTMTMKMKMKRQQTVRRVSRAETC